MAWLVSEVQGLLDKKLMDDSVVGLAVRAAQEGLTLDLMLDPLGWAKMYRTRLGLVRFG